MVAVVEHYRGTEIELKVAEARQSELMMAVQYLQLQLESKATRVLHPPPVRSFHAIVWSVNLW